MAIFQAPGSNALKVSSTVRETMEQLSHNFPQGIGYEVVYDPTTNVREGIAEVAKTLFEAILLVVIVVVLFLQTWRASIIPLVAVPVSIVGTFAVLLAFGFSINTLSLFGLVLAIGIVVDDAIVVVENVERNIAAGLSPREASYKAMEEVSRPIIAIALVLCAVFVPVAFVSGLTGQFYRQFALTIAFSTVISAINSLTLSPALSAILLRSHGATPDRLTRRARLPVRLVVPPLQPPVRARVRMPTDARRAGSSGGAVWRSLVYGGLLAVTAFGFSRLPSGFVPTQDKRYLVAFAQLPDARHAGSHDDVVRKMAEIGLKQPGIVGRRAVPGPVDQRIRQRVQRRHHLLCADAVRRAADQGALRPGDRRGAEPEVRGHPGRVRRRLPATAGHGPRHRRWVQDGDRGSRRARRGGAGQGDTSADRSRAYQTPELAGLFSS